jgi:DNA polymerase III subunit gamma/tau
VPSAGAPAVAPAGPLAVAPAVVRAPVAVPSSAVVVGVPRAPARLPVPAAPPVTGVLAVTVVRPTAEPTAEPTEEPRPVTWVPPAAPAVVAALTGRTVAAPAPAGPLPQPEAAFTDPFTGPWAKQAPDPVAGTPEKVFGAFPVPGLPVVTVPGQ